MRLRFILSGLLLLGSLSAESMPWARLKVGMAAEEILTLLGDPVLRCHGRGFETWTYDDGAEVLIYGSVVGWTTPASATARVCSDDVWRQHPRGDYFATLRSSVPKGVVRRPGMAPARPPAEKQPTGLGLGYERLLRG